MDCLVSELLVLFLLLIVCLRVFSRISSRRDIFVVLVPVAFIFSLLIFVAWGINLPTLLVFLMVIFVFAVNIHSLFRLFSGLMTDYYSFSLQFFSVVSGILIIFVGTFIVITRPVELPLEELSVKQENLLLTGSYVKEFNQRDSAFDSLDAKIFCYTPEYSSQYAEESKLPLVICVIENRQTVETMMPFVVQLASYGYKVVLADFKPFVFKPAWQRLTSLLETDSEKQSEAKTLAVAQYNSLIQYYTKENNHSALMLVGDGVCGQVLSTVAELNSGKIDAWFSINGMASDGKNYPLDNWRNGYGFLQEASPWLAIFVKDTGFNGCRDTSRFDSVYAAIQVNQVFKKALQQTGGIL